VVVEDAQLEQGRFHGRKGWGVGLGFQKMEIFLEFQKMEIFLEFQKMEIFLEFQKMEIGKQTSRQQE
jgi:hypothetical protein